MFQTQTGQQQFLVGGEMLRPIGALPLVRDGSIVCNELDTCVFLNPSSVDGDSPLPGLQPLGLDPFMLAGSSEDLLGPNFQA